MNENLISKINNEIFMLKLSIDSFKNAYEKKFNNETIKKLSETAARIYKDFSINATKGIPLTTAKRDAFLHILNNMKNEISTIKSDDRLVNYEIADMIKKMDTITSLLKKLRTKNKRITKKY